MPNVHQMSLMFPDSIRHTILRGMLVYDPTRYARIRSYEVRCCNEGDNLSEIPESDHLIGMSVRWWKIYLNRQKVTVHMWEVADSPKMYLGSTGSVGNNVIMHFCLRVWRQCR